MLRLPLLLASGLTLVLWSPATGAQPSTPPTSPRPGEPAPLEQRLSVARGQGASDCPDAPALAAAVTPLLVSPLPPGLRIDVQIGRSPAGYEARVQTSGQRTGQRTVVDPSDRCEALADALAVMVAMMLDGRDARPASASGTASATGATGASGASGAASATGERTPGDPPPPAAPRPLALALVVAVESTVGVIARGSTGPAAELALRLPSGGELALGASYLPPSAYAEAPGEVRVSLVSARLRGCWLGSPGRGAVEVGGCALGWVGRMQGQGQGYFRDRTPASPWGAVGPGLIARSRATGRLGWLAEVGLLVPLRQQTFSVDRVGDGPVFETPAVAGFARLGVWATIF